jgi:hypothetical protein
MSTQFVKPFAKSNKNDFLDAEAVDRQNTTFVPIKKPAPPHAAAIRR